jgi:hypothetical protein
LCSFVTLYFGIYLLIKIGAVDKEAVQAAIKEAAQKVQSMHTIGGGVQKAADLGTQASTSFDTAYKASNVLDPLKVFDSVVKGLGDVRLMSSIYLYFQPLMSVYRSIHM